jgi:hypothetical protein
MHNALYVFLSDLRHDNYVGNINIAPPYITTLYGLVNAIKIDLWL